MRTGTSHRDASDAVPLLRAGSLRRSCRTVATALICLALAACGELPRGAAFESEILQASTDAATPADFMVAPVTRALLPVYASWPHPGERRLHWISATPEPPNRIIAPGDVLRMTIWTAEDNSLLTAPGQRAIAMDAVTVSAGGTVFMPYVGTVRVAGMSPESARAAIEARYAEVTPSAQVQLELAETRGNMVSLVGGVRAPGSFPLRDQSYSVLSLIAEGGGVEPGLNNPQITLMRGGQVFGTSVRRLFEDPRLDTTLRGGDRVIVQADDRFFLSLGAAGTEAVHPFPRDEITALEAISIIGGVAETRANPRGLLILREYPASSVRADGTGPTHQRVVFTIDLTTTDGLFSAGEFRIASGDLVYATESPVAGAQGIIGLIGGSLGIVRTASSL